MDKLTRLGKAVLIASLLAGSASQLAACQKGPLEEAGEEVDHAIDKAKDAVD